MTHNRTVDREGIDDVFASIHSRGGDTDTSALNFRQGTMGWGGEQFLILFRRKNYAFESALASALLFLIE